MGTISVSLPTDGSTAEVADYNTPITTIVNAINGNLDSTNMSSLSGTKLQAGTVPGTALDANSAGGWITGVPAPSSVAYSGNRSYSLVFSTTDLTGYLSPGMRLRATRSVSAPTQCTSLNGSTQYYSKTTPAGMTFTDDFTVSAWVKITSYVDSTITSRYNGTSGWVFKTESSGQITLAGYNASASNVSLVTSYRSIPLNKWVHITAQLDMSTFTASTTTSYVMIDGVDVMAAVSRAGTNPTALVQAGNLEVGSRNGGTQPFPGKIAQVAIFSAKVAQSTIQTYISQSLAGTETSLISAYSFNNTINDLNTSNANNLTANGSAIATNADSPFGGQASGLISSTLEYGEISSVTFSTDTTIVVRVTDVNTLPTSGGVSAVAYSSSSAPYGFSRMTRIIGETQVSTDSANTSNTALQVPGLTVLGYVPVNRRARLNFVSRSVFNGTSGEIVTISLWDGVVGSGTSVGEYIFDQAGANDFKVPAISVLLPVSSGLKTYNLAMQRVSAGTNTLNMTTVSPGRFTLELEE